MDGTAGTVQQHMHWTSGHSCMFQGQALFALVFYYSLLLNVNDFNVTKIFLVCSKV
jgi:hypothetical protein